MTGRLVVMSIGLCLLAGACGDGASSGQADPVEIFVPLATVELLAESLADFETETGIAVRVTGTNSFVDDLVEQVGAALPPDVALVPQPGVVTMLGRSGDLVPLDGPTTDAIDESLDPRLRSLVEVDGVATAVPVRLSVKSLVWYRPDVIAELGVELPTDLDELSSLSQDLRARGIAPWCVGIEAGGATGWVATDWVEDLLLRRSGPDVYDRWVAGEIAFASPEVADAFTAFDELVLAPGLASGGTSNVLRTPFDRSIDGLLTDPVECVFHRQASFAYGWIRDDVRFGSDGDLDFFVLPTADDGDVPLLVGATVAVAFSDRPEVAALMRHLATPEGSRAWAEAGGFVSPHRAGPAGPGGEFGDRLYGILDMAGTVRLDASDSMEPEIGSGLLWREITKWVSGVSSHRELATRVDEARAGLAATG